MKLLIVGTGEPIPSVGWGPIEKLIGESIKLLTSNYGQDVTLHNARQNRSLSALMAYPWRFDVIHIQEEHAVRAWLKYRRWLPAPLVVTSHYGYFAWPERWSPLFRKKVFPYILKVPNFIALSNEIKVTLLNLGYEGTIHHLPNGVSCKDIRFSPVAERGAVVLGRIEPRKKQLFLCELLSGSPVTLDLIGPIADDMDKDFDGNGRNVRYLGAWSRKQVNDDLTCYSTVVLLSDGEAHPLAVLEALAAGASVVVSEEASHNLQADLPFVFVVDRNDKQQVQQAIQEATETNSLHRQRIREYCLENFDWTVILPRYIKILDEIRDSHRST